MPRQAVGRAPDEVWAKVKATHVEPGQPGRHAGALDEVGQGQQVEVQDVGLQVAAGVHQVAQQARGVVGHHAEGLVEGQGGVGCLEGAGEGVHGLPHDQRLFDRDESVPLVRGLGDGAPAQAPILHGLLLACRGDVGGVAGHEPAGA